MCMIQDRFPALGLYYGGPAQHVVPAAYDLDDISVGYLSVDYPSVGDLYIDALSVDDLSVDNPSVGGICIDALSVDALSVDDLSVDDLSIYDISLDNLFVDNLSVDNLSVDNLSVDGMSDLYGGLAVFGFPMYHVPRFCFFLIPELVRSPTWRFWFTWLCFAALDVRHVLCFYLGCCIHPTSLSCDSLVTVL